MLRWMLLAFMTTNALAAPQLIEVWFLSNSKVAELNKLLDRSHYVYRKPTAALECQEMGDFCFDPQFGLYKKEDGTDASAESMEASGTSIPVAKSVERDLINCDPKNYFDIFCGKAKAETKSISSLDVWIDTSGSMHEFDFPDKDGGCHRKSFMKKLDQSCGFNQKVN